MSYQPVEATLEVRLGRHHRSDSRASP